MKNKEIEELLNEHNYPLSDYYLFNKKDIDLLLSYIEQLEKENKILRENAEHNDKVVDKVNWENQQLKKQKDDVVEYIKSVELGELVNGKPYYLKEDSIGKDLLRMLGEIDEKSND